MAKKTIVQLVDDLDGTELKPGSGETIPFALDGVAYELDLSARNAKKFRKDLEAYIAAARKVSKGRAPRKRSQNGPAPQDIRAWGRDNGYEVPDRGVIPRAVREAYVAAH